MFLLSALLIVSYGAHNHQTEIEKKLASQTSFKVWGLSQDIASSTQAHTYTHR